MKKIILLAIITIFIFSIFAVESHARSEIIKTGECSYEVRIFIAFATSNTTLIDEWKDQMDDTWNPGILPWTFGDCDCDVEFKFYTKNVTDCKNAGAGWHCFNVTSNATNRRNNTADATVTRPNTTDSTGEWSTRTSPLSAAHEVGHMLGLGEEYAYVNGTYTVTGNDSMSIMARTWNNTTGHDPHVNQWHVNQIMAGVDCPDICCCGNNKANPGKEECEPTLTPNGCPPEKPICTDNCTCVGQPVTTPRCGDGEIYQPPNYGQPGVGGEDCDWNRTPTGCKDGEECTKDCRCVNCTSSVAIDDPTSGHFLEDIFPVKITLSDLISTHQTVKYYIDETLVHTDNSDPFEYSIDPSTLVQGNHWLEVKLFDGDCTDNDSVLFEVGFAEMYECGDQNCDFEFGEMCDTCPDDCVCDELELCMPGDPAANEIGCAPIVDCGDGICGGAETCEMCPEDCECVGGVCDPENQEADERGCIY